MIERMAIKRRLLEKTDVKDLFYDKVYKMSVKSWKRSHVNTKTNFTLFNLINHHITNILWDVCTGDFAAFHQCLEGCGGHIRSHDYSPGLHFNQSKALVPVCTVLIPSKGRGLFLPVSLSSSHSTPRSTPPRSYVSSGFQHRPHSALRHSIRSLFIQFHDAVEDFLVAVVN